MPALLESVGSALPGLLLRVSVVLLLAWAIQRVLPRRTSSAVRHLAWTLALVGVLVLPLVPLLAPSWTLEVRRVVPADAVSTESAPIVADDDAGGGAMTSAGDAARGVTTGAAARPTMTAWVGVVYLAGLTFALAQVVRRRYQLWRFCRGSRPIADGPWLELLVRCAAVMDVRDGVRLLRGGHVVPMTCGTWRPAVVVPAVADTWDADRREAVLLHELAHVVRRDCFTQLLASLACAVAWCHPGVWWAVRRMRQEREVACDDRVVIAGAPARGYAGHLLDIAYAFAQDRAPAHALAMARPRQLETRMRALLDGGRDRRPAGWPTTGALAALGAALLLPIATFTATVVAVAPTPDGPPMLVAAATPSPMLPMSGRTAQAVGTWRDVAKRTAEQAPQPQRAPVRDDEDPDAPGTWEVRPGGVDGTVHLRMTQGRSSNGHSVRVETFAGLAEAMRGAAGAPARFQLKRDAGTFVFDGVFKGGVGAGTFSFTPDGSFPDALARRGFARPTAREQYQMARHDVGFALIDALAEQGYLKPQTADLIRAGQHGVSATYVREMGGLGYKLGTLDGLITLRDHGVTPTYVRELAELGYKGLSADQLRNARDHGVTPDYVRGMAAAGYTSVAMPDLVNARDHGVTPDFVRGLADAGYRGLALEEAIKVRDHGVTPDYVKVMREHGYTGPIADLVRARDHGVSADHVKEMAALGYARIPLDVLVRMRDHGVSSGYVKELKALGYERLAPDDLVTLRDHGFTAARIKRINERSGKTLPVDALLAALRQGKAEP